MAFPSDTQEGLESFYCRHQLKTNGLPTARWESNHLTTISTPYPLTLSWDLAVQIKRITCHKLVAPSLSRILSEILAHYGSVNAIKTARMHLFGGCYNYRRISGGGRLSTHAWGAGIDIDPDRNPLGVPHSESTGMMPLSVVEIFERHGWKWGGRFVSRPDCMHFQATS
jgi:hypothetical protein